MTSPPLTVKVVVKDKTFDQLAPTALDSILVEDKHAKCV